MQTDLRDQTELTFLERRVVLEMRNGISMIIGRLQPDIRLPIEFITFQHPIFGLMHASLIRVDHKTVWYRQVMKDAAVNEDGGNIQFSGQQK